MEKVLIENLFLDLENDKLGGVFCTDTTYDAGVVMMKSSVENKIIAIF